MFKYRVSMFYRPTIEKKEIERETGKSVFWKELSGRTNSERKETQYYRWFDTWKEGHDFMMEQAQAKVDSLRRQLETAKGTLGNIKGMKAN